MAADVHNLLPVVTRHVQQLTISLLAVIVVMLRLCIIRYQDLSSCKQSPTYLSTSPLPMTDHGLRILVI